MVSTMLPVPDEQKVPVTMREPLYPLRFEPVLKRLIWGGRRLETLLGKAIGPECDYAESWEIADHKQGVTRVAEGPLQGVGLSDLMRDRGPELLGPSLSEVEQFPLLVKFLDAHQVLSVQVHPDDAQARVLTQDNGKTETWVVIHAEPGSLIYAGLRPGVTRDQFAKAVEEGTVEPLLHRFEARSGDGIFIPAGTVHAIGAGVVLAEIQQMSDATFRIHDWGRLGPDGCPRALHLDEAMLSIDFDAGPVEPVRVQPELIPGGTREFLATSTHFCLERLRLRGPASVGSRERFTILIGLGGAAEVHSEGRVTPLGFGQTLLLPASIGPCELTPRDPGIETTVLTCIVP